MSRKSDENKSFKPNQIAPSIYTIIKLCFFFLDQWETKIHLLWGKSFNIPHWSLGFWPMRNIEAFPSKQMYLYLSLVERNEAEIYHNIDRRRYLVWFKWLIFFTFSRQFLVFLSSRPLPFEGPRRRIHASLQACKPGLQAPSNLAGSGAPRQK